MAAALLIAYLVQLPVQLVVIWHRQGSAILESLAWPMGFMVSLSLAAGLICFTGETKATTIILILGLAVLVIRCLIVDGPTVLGHFFDSLGKVRS
jgi:hypothetical protein